MRKHYFFRFVALCGVACILGLIPAYGQGPSNDPPVSSSSIKSSWPGAQEPYWAQHGRLTLGFQMGFGLENNIPNNISHINMFFVEPQVGIIGWDSPHSRLPIKRFELISEGILGGSSHPGGHLFGTALILRFGFKPMGRFVPYFDAGSGPVHTTIDENAPEITGHTQFLSQGGVGLQYFFKPQRAMVIEYHYFHMSNAGLQQPNHGFNGSMVTIGFRWLRSPRPVAMGALRHLGIHLPHL